VRIACAAQLSERAVLVQNSAHAGERTPVIVIQLIDMLVYWRLLAEVFNGICFKNCLYGFVIILHFILGGDVKWIIIVCHRIAFN
jgi:hypothetical protein